ncbi:MAG TPA: alpha/beta hydrolase [Acidimicrobiia bacterium]|nr:alpha/beta hydrolase [Acidimicrobiia bacterium]
MATVDLHGADGIRLRADEFGDPSDPPVVLLHGGGQTRFAWGTTPRVLADRGWHAFRVDLRGHGESEWPDDGDYSLWAFADDTRALAASMPSRPVLVGASLGGLSSMVAIGESSEPVARALVLVDVAPTMEESGKERIGAFMREHVETGFGSLDEVADAIAAYNPHRPRPSNLSGLQKNVRRRDDGRWVWHWDPRFMTQSPDETRSSFASTDRLRDAARNLDVPVLLVRGRMSDLLSEEGAKELLELVPHAEYADVAGAGHMVAGDRNDLFNDAIVGFLDRLH